MCKLLRAGKLSQLKSRGHPTGDLLLKRLGAFKSEK
jgi:hypothetical protein